MPNLIRLCFACLFFASMPAIADDSKVDELLKNIQEMAGQDSSSEYSKQARDIVKSLHSGYGNNNSYRNSSNDNVHKVEIRVKKKTEIEKREALPEATTGDIFK